MRLPTSELSPGESPVPPFRSSVVLLALLIACGGGDAPTAPNAVPLSPGGTPPAGPGATGQWQRTGYAVTGSVNMVVENGVAKVTFSPDFSIMQTPGPTVYINTTNNPNTGQPLRIGALKSLRGDQTYTFQIPVGPRYTWVLIWCDPFNAAMAEAAIPPTP